MSKLQKKQRTIEMENVTINVGRTHADDIEIIRSSGDVTWRNSRHCKKAYTKLKQGRVLNNKEADYYYPEHTANSYYK